LYVGLEVFAVENWALLVARGALWLIQMCSSLIFHCSLISSSVYFTNEEDVVTVQVM